MKADKSQYAAIGTGGPNKGRSHYARPDYASEAIDEAKEGLAREILRDIVRSERHAAGKQATQNEASEYLMTWITDQVDKSAKVSHVQDNNPVNADAKFVEDDPLLDRSVVEDDRQFDKKDIVTVIVSIPKEEIISRWKLEQAKRAGTEAPNDPGQQGVPGDPRIPEFPWPPPRASAFMTIPDDLLPHTSTSTLDDVKSTLGAALLQGGYSEVSYFAVPSGFALVSRIERIGKDGLPLGDGRWSSAKTASGSNSLFENLRDLLFVRPGFFRILVFVVSSEPFTQQGPAVEKEKAESWVREGATALPPAIGDVQYSRHYSTVALVYEFEQPEKDTPAKLLDPGRLSTREHLETAGVWKALNRVRQ